MTPFEASVQAILRNKILGVLPNWNYWNKLSLYLVEGMWDACTRGEGGLDMSKHWERQYKSEKKYCEYRGFAEFIRMWYERLNIWQQSWFMVRYASAVASYHDYVKIGASIAPPELIEARRIQVQLGPTSNIPKYISPSMGKIMFERGDTGTGSIIQLSMTTVCQVLGRDLIDWELEYVAAQIGEVEWSVAAILLLFNCYDIRVRNWVIEHKFHHIPVSSIKEVVGDWLNALKRCPILIGAEGIPPEMVLGLRKMAACATRRKGNADWVWERERRTADLAVHYAINPEGVLDRDLWILMASRNTEKLAKEVVAGVTGNTELGTIDKWWSERSAWMPSGSTSARAEWKKGIAEGLVHPEDRPSKKEIAEALPDDYVHKILSVLPIQPARGSTKVEPGDKWRAILATGDEHFFAASYASLHIEKHMNIGGIRSKQTPADVVEWTVMSEQTPQGAQWNSLDYKEYNTEHESWLLAKFNHALAQSWNDSDASPAVKDDKVKAAKWVARSHSNIWMQGKESGTVRLFGGLFSGCRDTARDNSGLHGVYSDCIFEMLQPADPGIKAIQRNITGDDEDTLLKDWVQNMLYLDAHRQCGFVLKNAKQCTGSIHEFLQRQAGPGFLPTRPLAALLAVLSSGNWYKDMSIWYDTAVSAISDNLWEAHIRGMPLIYARRLAKIIIDATMRVPVHTGGDKDGNGDKREWKELEWWAFRHGSGAHALWSGTKGDATTPPTISAKPAADRRLPSLGAKAMIRNRKKFLNLSEEKWDRYEQEILRESYAALHLKARVDAHREYAKEMWPKRIHNVQDSDLMVAGPVAPSRSAVMSRLNSGGSDRRPSSVEEILARVDMDAQLLSLAGGWTALLGMLPKGMLSKFEWPSEPGVVPLAWKMLDPAIQAWLAQNTAMPMHAKNTGTPQRISAIKAGVGTVGVIALDKLGRQEYTVYLAPNGAGKSTFAWKQGDLLDLDKAVVDTRTYGAYKTVNRHKTEQEMFLENLRTMLWQELQQGYYRGWVAQYKVSHLVPPRSERSYVVKIIVVEPDRAVIAQRLEARGWSKERIEKRWSRWESVKEDLKTTRNLSQEEKKGITHLKEW
jgi:hypothetical protein